MVIEFTEARREQWQQAQRGKTMSPESKEKMRQAALGRKMSEEQKQKISATCMGRIPWNKGIRTNINANAND